MQVDVDVVGVVEEDNQDNREAWPHHRDMGTVGLDIVGGVVLDEQSWSVGDGVQEGRV